MEGNDLGRLLDGSGRGQFLKISEATRSHCVLTLPDLLRYRDNSCALRRCGLSGHGQ